MKFATRAVHDGEDPHTVPSGDVVVPVHLASTFARKELAQLPMGFEYSRTSNPTRLALEKRLASLENAKFALAFASGMAAETTLLLSALKRGDHVIAGDDIYGGTRRLFDKVFARFGVSVSYVDTRSLEKVERAARRNTTMLWLESPTNPLMRLCDIRALSRLGRSRGLLTVVDNTFASPFIQNPLDLGATVVVHSTTKYIGGHSDVVGGSLMLSDPELHESIRFNQNALGAVPSPFDCFLLLRGSKTLHLRMERHSRNAQRVAKFLEGHDRVAAVNYPGLKSHPQRTLARRQMRLPGGMLSFEMKGGLKDAREFLGRLSVFSLAESLGGVESLADHPASMTHASVSPRERRKLGIGDTLIRLSVGIEDGSDLVEDLRKALS
ncbi:MAG TPA: PLP-dependent aspartate aminotransferase family protein [Nitrososphaerales archaeon]|nr:PLP-dependent aspartate aminotransferase family protein [Nitrososphaerales archaeon]